MFGIGYEGLTIDAFIEDLKRRGADVVVDVRLNALSRKAGYSKRSLAAALDAAGIRYLHERRLGNPRDNRAAYSEPGSKDGIAARDRFRDLLAAADGAEGLGTIVELMEEHTVAVLCYEASETHCHREQVLEAARELRASLVRS
jgi:uncharacterized protein (DUF488 family)